MGQRVRTGRVRAKAQYGVQWVIIMILYNCLLYDCHRLLVINHILSPHSTTLHGLFPLCICVCFAVLFALFILYVCMSLSLSLSVSLSVSVSLSICVPFLLSHVTCNCSWIGRKTTGSAAAPGRFGNALSLPLAALTKLLAKLSGSFRFVSF